MDLAPLADAINKHIVETRFVMSDRLRHQIVFAFLVEHKKQWLIDASSVYTQDERDTLLRRWLATFDYWLATSCESQEVADYWCNGADS